MSEDHNRTDASPATATADQLDSLHYDVRVKGHLDARWASRFPGLRLTNDADGTTLIHGPVVDQAALHGLLQQLRDIGLPLLSVTQVEADGLDATATDH